MNSGLHVWLKSEKPRYFPRALVGSEKKEQFPETQLAEIKS